MGLKDLIAADVSRVILNTEDFAESITRWPEGTQALAESVTAIFLPEESNRDTSRGEETVIPAAVIVSESQEVHRDDVWVIDEQEYATLAIHDPLHGSRTIDVHRIDRKHTTRHQTGGLL